MVKNRKSLQEVFIILINKMLEYHSIDINYVIDHPQIDGIPWYQYYTWTTEQEREYKKWFIEFLKKEIRCSKSYAKLEYSMFDLKYGLKINDDENNS